MKPIHAWHELGPAERDEVAPEYRAPAFTSADLQVSRDLPTGGFWQSVVGGARDESPHVEFFGSHHWGCATVEFARDAATHTTYAVDKSAPAQDAGRRTPATIRAPTAPIALRESRSFDRRLCAAC